MQRKHNQTRVVCVAVCLAALTALVFAGSASAKLTGEFVKFEQCPYKNTEVRKCIVSPTEGGEVILGNKTVPITATATLQGGFARPNEETSFSKFFGAVNGITLSKAAQTVPGGLAGIVPEASSPPLVKALIKFFFENKITGLTSTLELAKPASEIQISESHLIEEEGITLRLPVQIHLENPFLGKSCLVGSSSSPIWWELTTGKTSPPPPNTSITGFGGELTLFEEGSVLQLKKTVLVDNKWSAPGASGCGGILGFLVNPIVNAQLGTTTAGHNTAILKNTVNVASAAAMRLNNEEHP